MKVLITGATGLVGNELTKLMLQNGYKINYLTTSQKKIVKQPNYNGFYWNPDKGIIDENALLGVQTIIHLAGANVAKRWTSNYKQQILESRIVTADLIYNVLKNNPHQVTQIISASGIAIYTDSLTTIYTEETTETENTFLGNVVLKWEQAIDKFKNLGLITCKLRTGIVLSAQAGAMFEMLKPIRLGLGSPFGTGQHFQSWIHIQDLANIYMFTVKNQLNGTFNAVAPEPITNQKLTETLAKHLQKPLFMPNIPKFFMKLILGEMHQILFSSQNVSSNKIQQTGFKYQYPTIEKAVQNLI